MRKGREGSESIYHPHYSIAHMCDMKIQQEAKLDPTELQIAQKLTSMHRQDRLNGLQFDDDPVSDKKIEAIAVVDREILVSDGDQHLSTRRDTEFLQLVDQ